MSMFADEDLLTLSQAAEMLPRGRDGKKRHLSTLWRWITYGVRGQKLESILIGNVRYTSREAIDRFIARLNAVRPADSTPPASARKLAEHEDRSAAFRRQLHAAGIGRPVDTTPKQSSLIEPPKKAVCSVCKETPLRKNNQLGICQQHPECVKARKRAWRAANREKDLNWNRQWKARNPDRVISRQRFYRATHRQAKRDQDARYRSAKREQTLIEDLSLLRTALTQCPRETDRG